MSLIQIYYKARKTCLQMLTDRKYNVPAHLALMTFPQFEIVFKSKQMDLVGITDDEKLPVFVKMHNGPPISKKEQKGQPKVIDNIYAEAAAHFASIGLDVATPDEAGLSEGKCRVIIVYNESEPRLSSDFKLEQEMISHRFIEIHTVQKMAINPILNKYQPKFRLVTDKKEIDEIYAEYNAKPIQFGSICINDPINRYFHGLPADASGFNGHLFEVHRGGVNVYYRKVAAKMMNIK